MMAYYRVGLCALGLVLLSACGGGGSSSTSNPAAPPTQNISVLPPAPPAVVPDDARGALPGLNGVRAAMSFTADWEMGRCATLTVFNRHPSAALQGWQAVIDLGAWELQSTSGGRAAESTGFITLKSETLASPIAAGSSGQAKVCVKPQVTPARNPVVVSIASDLPSPGADEFETGLWRIAAPSSRLTMSWYATGMFKLQPYSGHPDQQWRLQAQGNGYRLMLESRGQCMSSTGAAVSLVACSDSGITWTMETVRARTDDRPGLFRLRRGDPGCLRLTEPAAATLGPCDTEANLYLEAAGYGERTAPVEFELRGLLLIKPSTDVASPRMIGRIPDETIAAVQVAYRDHLAVWFNRITDGRLRWVGDSVVASPMTSATTDGGNRLPAAFTMPDDVSRFLPPGRYDTAAVFFTAGKDADGATVPGGWGWGPGISAESNYTMWVTVNGGATPAAEWVSWLNEPMEVFVHEPMHGLDGYFDKLRVPLPDGYLHASEANLYARTQYGWMPWYRDILLGRVIAADDTYRGYGPRAYKLGPPRLAAPH